MVTYLHSGVNINKANRFVDWIKKNNPDIGMFGGFYQLKNYKAPILVASCDGVGTKIKIAQLVNKYENLGIDLVAMNVNDIICCGAKPIFFLDYIAAGKLNLKIAKTIIKSIIKGCVEADCVLLGGETAQMPDVYKNNDFDIAGFSVGIAKKEEILPKNIISGDYVFGLPSNGVHSNGFSLIRKIFTELKLKSLSNELLKPTKIYVKSILTLKQLLKGVAHITGGGFYENIPRILPKNKIAVIKKNSWDIPEIFNIIQKQGNISNKEMFRVFNMGIGMVVICDNENFKKVKDFVKNIFLIGWIEDSKNGRRVEFI